MSLRSLSGQIELNAPTEKVFQYFTDTDQFASLLPQNLRLRILRRSARHLIQGATLEIKTSLFMAPMRWKLYVQSFSHARHIACVWECGSFFSLELDDYFESLPHNQTRVTDCVLYRAPLGLVGTWIDRLWMRARLQQIFEHRRRALLSIFQPAQRHPAPERASKVSK